MKRANLRTKGLWMLPAVFALALVAFPGLAGASPSAPAVTVASGTSTQWAYGAQESVNFSVSANGNTYSFSGSYGLHVIVTLTNTSSTSYTLEVERTMGFHIWANVTTANVTVRFTAQAWEQSTGFVNVTSAGHVYENGVTVPAIAIVNASTQQRANLTEGATVSTVVLGHTFTAKASFDAALADHATIVFTPAIGIVPLNLTNGATWNSSAAYAVSGGASGKYSWSRTAFNGNTTSSSGSLSSSLSASGTVALAGAVVGHITLKDGDSLPVIELVITGPLHLEEGLLWVPASADLWGATQTSLNGAAVASVDTATDRIDAIVDVHGHLTVGASLTHLSSTPQSGAVGLGSVGPVGPLATGGSPPSGGANGAQIQTQPESVQQARSASQCLVTTCTSGPVSGFLGSRLGFVVVAGAVVGLAALVAALVASRRRKIRPPSGPTSAFPPGAAGVVAAPAIPRNGTNGQPPKEPEQQDPLGHLY